jgi:hypothetical protein
MSIFQIIPDTYHYVSSRVQNGDGEWTNEFTITGIAKGDVEGYPGGWTNNSVNINVFIPGYGPGSSATFQIDRWAPLVTFAGMETNVDWIIDKTYVYNGYVPLTNVAIFSDIRIRGGDSVLHLAYSLHLRQTNL